MNRELHPHTQVLELDAPVSTHAPPLLREPQAVAPPSRVATPKSPRAAARTSCSALERLLENNDPERGPDCSFVGAVSLLTALHPDAPRPGEYGPFAKECVVFRHSPDLQFNAGEVDAVRERSPGSYEVQANFLGLSGSSSPTPHYLNEPLAQPGEHVETQRDYLDVFHHRLYGLLYRGLRLGDIPGQLAAEPKHPWRDRLANLLGLSASKIAKLRVLKLASLLSLAPLLSGQVRSKAVLETAINHVLAPYLEHPQRDERARVHIEEWTGSWTQFEDRSQFRLGQANHALGDATVLGKRILHRAAQARIEISPLHPSSQHYFEADGPGYQTLAELLDLCLDDPIDFTLDLKVQYENADHCTLGTSRLGVDSVLPGATPNALRHIERSLPALVASSEPARHADPAEPGPPAPLTFS